MVRDVYFLYDRARESFIAGRDKTGCFRYSKHPKHAMLVAPNSSYLNCSPNITPIPLTLEECLEDGTHIDVTAYDVQFCIKSRGYYFEGFDNCGDPADGEDILRAARYSSYSDCRRVLQELGMSPEECVSRLIFRNRN